MSIFLRISEQLPEKYVKYVGLDCYVGLLPTDPLALPERFTSYGNLIYKNIKEAYEEFLDVGKTQGKDLSKEIKSANDLEIRLNQSLDVEYNDVRLYGDYDEKVGYNMAYYSANASLKAEVLGVEFEGCFAITHKNPFRRGGLRYIADDRATEGLQNSLDAYFEENKVLSEVELFVSKETKQRNLPAELSKMVLTEFKQYASDIYSDLPDSSSEWFDLSTIVLTKEQEDVLDDFCDAIEDCESPIVKHIGYIYDHFK